MLSQYNGKLLPLKSRKIINEQSFTSITRRQYVNELVHYIDFSCRVHTGHQHLTHFPDQLEAIATVLNMQGLDSAIKVY